MKVKCQVCSPNSVRKGKGVKEKTHEHVILLDSINY